MSTIPTVQIPSDDLKKFMTTLINDYIRIEITETGLNYQQKNNFKMGQISIIAMLIGETWDFHRTGQSYYDFLKYLVEKYELSGVLRINDLWEPRKK
ncbi:hypothetical protein MOF23_22360 [Bacillus inaquosorum]|uniref:hypothetical protein n=1 Tax=Bacillus subtilis group TaxID=653685 RepID=UPI00227F3AA8|nr:MULTISPECIES: hypothetical protein [Bacillus subtilis group]MCY9311678.1 hypothetical protein [Bacillus inaquosorum]MCY9367538.1 hypothetical protein [Bacillus spizizenii]WJE41199.1 hypothetical protein QRD86_00150 [Bacillus halotolerans]